MLHHWLKKHLFSLYIDKNLLVNNVACFIACRGRIHSANPRLIAQPRMIVMMIVRN